MFIAFGMTYRPKSDTWVPYIVYKVPDTTTEKATKIEQQYLL